VEHTDQHIRWTGLWCGPSAAPPIFAARSCLSETANREMPTELDLGKSFDKSCRSANAEDDQGRAAAFRSRDPGQALLVRREGGFVIRRAHVARAGESFADQLPAFDGLR
jgi:hypothetical protein